MQITRMEITDFATVSDIAVDFSPNVNVLCDFDVASVSDFIIFMFYGAGKDDVNSYFRDGKDTVSGKLYFTHKKKNYTVTRSAKLTDSGVVNECETVDSASGRRHFTSDILGVALFGTDKDSFSKYAFPGIPYDENTTKEKLHNFCFSLDDSLSFDDGITETSDACKTLIHLNRDGGIIPCEQSKLAELRKELKDNFSQTETVFGIVGKIKEAEIRESAAKETYESQKSLEYMCRCSNLIEEFDRMHEMEKTREKQTDDVAAYREKNGYMGFCPDDEYRREVALSFYRMRMSGKRYAASVQEYCKFNAESVLDRRTEEILRRAESLGGTEIVRSGYDNSLKSYRSLASYGLACLSVFLMFLIVGLVLPVIQETYRSEWIIGEFILSVSSLILFAVALYYRNICVKMARDFDVKMQSELQGVLNSVDSAKKTVKARKERLDMIKAECDAAKTECDNSLEDFKKNVERWGRKLPSRHLRNFTYNLDADIKKYIDGEENLRLLLRSTETEIANIREKLRDYNEIDVRAVVLPKERDKYRSMNYSEVYEQLMQRQTELDSITTELSSMREEKNRIIESMRPSSRIRQEIIMQEEYISGLQTDYDVYKCASETLAEARNNMSTGIAATVIASARKTAELVTDESADVKPKKHRKNKVTSAIEENLMYLDLQNADRSYYSARLAFLKYLTHGTSILIINASAVVANDRINTLFSCAVKSGEEQTLVFVPSEHLPISESTDDVKIIKYTRKKDAPIATAK